MRSRQQHVNDVGHRLLDVGIGTGGALVGNAALVAERDLHITGVDIDPSYVKRARKNVEKAGLSERVSVRLESIYDHTDAEYDAAYFSASFMLLPDPVAALHQVSGLGVGRDCGFHSVGPVCRRNAWNLRLPKACSSRTRAGSRR